MSCSGTWWGVLHSANCHSDSHENCCIMNLLLWLGPCMWFGAPSSLSVTNLWALMYMWSGLLVDPSLLLPPGGGGADNDGDESDMGRLQGEGFVASL